MDNTTVAEQYEVTLTRVIKVGSRYNMAPSEAFSGIEAGAVRVLGLYQWDKMDENTQNNVSYYIDMLDPIDDNDYAMELKAQPWAAYSYLKMSTVDGILTPDIDFMPVSIFAQHSVSQY